jgi:non-ribosomal peptide synthetase component F
MIGCSRGLSVGFDANCEEMWLAWRNGAALVPAPRSVVRSGADLGLWLAERGVTVVSTVPTLAAMWDDELIAGVPAHTRWHGAPVAASIAPSAPKNLVLSC